MEKKSLAKELSGNSYPGRGIVIGKSADGKYAVTAYFIMGRSVNSRNRIFVDTPISFGSPSKLGSGLPSPIYVWINRPSPDGCNPNQKPSRIYMADGSELPIRVLNGKPGDIN